jgi:hypothetical protein
MQRDDARDASEWQADVPNPVARSVGTRYPETTEGRERAGPPRVVPFPHFHAFALRTFLRGRLTYFNAWLHRFFPFVWTKLIFINLFTSLNTFCRRGIFSQTWRKVIQEKVYNNFILTKQKNIHTLSLTPKVLCFFSFQNCHTMGYVLKLRNWSKSKEFLHILTIGSCSHLTWLLSHQISTVNSFYILRNLHLKLTELAFLDLQKLGKLWFEGRYLYFFSYKYSSPSWFYSTLVG